MPHFSALPTKSFDRPQAATAYNACVTCPTLGCFVFLFYLLPLFSHGVSSYYSCCSLLIMWLNCLLGISFLILLHKPRVAQFNLTSLRFNEIRNILHRSSISVVSGLFCSFYEIIKTLLLYIKVSIEK